MTSKLKRQRKDVAGSGTTVMRYMAPVGRPVTESSTLGARATDPDV
ncbi:MAG: hypothetical protein ABGX16_04795 [Pirellulales bacterium]